MNRPLTLLLVEDNPADVELFLESLQMRPKHTELHIVSSGDEALNFLERKGEFSGKPATDVIILDINLPKKDGIQVLKEIRGHEDRIVSSTPVVIVSVTQNPKEIQECYRAGANVFVTKPASVGDFMGVLQRIQQFWLETAVLPSRLAIRDHE